MTKRWVVRVYERDLHAFDKVFDRRGKAVEYAQYWNDNPNLKWRAELNNMAQIVTEEFVQWLKTTSFAGIVIAGDQWDTEVAWPSTSTMKAARACFNSFATGDLKQAEEHMHVAQSQEEGQ